jgi:hypothetical protein
VSNADHGSPNMHSGPENAQPSSWVSFKYATVALGIVTSILIVAFLVFSAYHTWKKMRKPEISGKQVLARSQTFVDAF